MCTKNLLLKWTYKIIVHNKMGKDDKIAPSKRNINEMLCSFDLADMARKQKRILCCAIFQIVIK
mgnify:CR=1 FL=1